MFPRKLPQTFAIYLLILAVLIAIAIGLAIVADEVDDGSFLWAFAWVPPVQFNLLDQVRRAHYGSYGGSSGTNPDFLPLLVTGMATCALYYLGLLLCAVRNFRFIREVEAEAATPTPGDP
jgi:hypothetical protein